ncbi:MAG: SPOR domain-containing protein [Alphaproteobacteria bacterium]|nr:SPOR domain-containing protein [Alphaproteobacteria bacterium]
MLRFICVVGLALLFGMPASAQKFEQAAAAYERGDFAAARQAWRRLAEKGDAQSQFMLGAVYATGKGVARDHAEAAKWYLKAADQGLAAAQNNLGFMYDRGLGVTQSDHEAVKWYIRAAEQGHAQAQNNLGVMYGTGRGVAKNNTEALKWFQLSADQGNPQARYNLSFLRSKEQPHVAERPLPKPDPDPSSSEVSISEESVTRKEGLAPEAPPETQVATTSAVPEAVAVREKPAEVKLEAIVSKKVSSDIKVAEKKQVFEPRPAPTTDDAGPVGALAKLEALKGGTAGPVAADVVVKAAAPPPPAKAAIATKAGEVAARGAALRDAPRAADRITLTAKTQIAALADAKPSEKADAAKPNPAKEKAAKETPAAPWHAKAQAVTKTLGNAKPAAPKAEPGAAAKGPTYQIQMGSVRAASDAAAAELVRRLAQSHKPALEGVKVFSLRADLGARGTFYRLRAGPFVDAFAAQAMCDRLKARKQPCFVLRR